MEAEKDILRSFQY